MADPITGLPLQSDWLPIGIFLTVFFTILSVAALNLYAHHVRKSGSSEATRFAAASHADELFMSCIACHGPDARGRPFLGSDLVASTFVKRKSDSELVDFLKVGRPAEHPDNTTKVTMPPRGGNPTLTDADLLVLVKHIRSLSLSESNPLK